MCLSFLERYLHHIITLLGTNRNKWTVSMSKMPSFRRLEGVHVVLLSLETIVFLPLHDKLFIKGRVEVSVK